MVAKGSPEQNEYAYLGSPVQNAQGQVVGVDSRPTPTVIESEDQPKPSFDASPFKRVRGKTLWDTALFGACTIGVIQADESQSICVKTSW